MINEEFQINREKMKYLVSNLWQMGSKSRPSVNTLHKYLMITRTKHEKM